MFNQDDVGKITCVGGELQGQRINFQGETLMVRHESDHQLYHLRKLVNPRTKSEELFYVADVLNEAELDKALSLL